MTLLGFVGEDEHHFWVVTTLIDHALVARIAWLRDVVESCRAWRGLRGGEPWHKYTLDDAYDLRPVTIDGVTIKRHGPIAGEPLKPEASMWRNVLLLFCHANPRPDIVVLARDLDGYPAAARGSSRYATACSGRSRSWRPPPSRRSKDGWYPASCRTTRTNKPGSKRCVESCPSTRRRTRIG